MIPCRYKSDFQILAHFAQPADAGAARFGWRMAEFAAEGGAEVAVAGKAEFKRERSQVVSALGQLFERSAQPQANQVAMNWHPGSLLKNPGEMKWRRARGSGDVVQRESLAQA